MEIFIFTLLETSLSHPDSFYYKMEGRSLKNMRAFMVFKPMISAIPVRCSTNGAVKPHIGSEVNLLSSLGARSICWVEHRTGIAEVTASNPVEEGLNGGGGGPFDG